MGVLEKDIQKLCIDVLKKNGCLVMRHNNVRVSGGKFVFVPKDELGAPDVICLYAGKCFCIEIKAPNKKQSIEQLMFEERVKKVQCYYILVDSIDKACNIFETIKNLDEIILTEKKEIEVEI